MHDNTIATSSQLRYETHSRLPQGAWQSFLDEEIGARARQAALFVAERMHDPEFVHATSKRSREQATYSTGWAPTSLGSGDTGVALMYEYIDRCFPKQGWNAQTQRYLNLIAADTHQSGLGSPSVFGGTSGLALVLSLAGREGTRYRKTLRSLNQGLCEQIMGQAWRRTERDHGVGAYDYDIISGAAGVLAYLVSLEQPDEQILTAIEQILAYLTWLAEPGQPLGNERWYIPPDLLPNDLHREESPQGNFNCGLAHGIPGPLAALSLASLAGYRYPGLHESIAYLANWLIEHSLSMPWGVDWPGCIQFEYAFDPQNWQALPPTRAAWCYGTPGVARSLWLAGQALADDRLRQVALQAIEVVLRRPASERSIPSAHICHGVAGLLQICLRFAHESEDTLVREHIPLLVEQILRAFNPTFVLGFCDLDEEKSIDNPTWLTGAPGIAMVLLAASTSVAPAWDRALAIA